MKRICVFCGSSPGVRPEYADAARALGAALLRRKLGLVYGGSSVGLMNVIANTVLDGGGEVIGVIPDSMIPWEVDHKGLTELHVVNSMHERKALMAEKADGFIAMPGGFGTFEEYCEVLTWAQLRFHQKPVGLLNIAGYYDAMLAMFDHAVTEQFVKPAYRALVLTASDPESLLDLLEQYQPPDGHKWFERDKT